MPRTLLLVLLMGRLLAGCTAAPVAPQAGSTSIDLAGIVLEDMRGERHDLGQRRAPVVLVFWQTWCGSCLAEGPRVVAARRAHPELEFYGVVSGPSDVIDDDEVRARSAALGYDFPQLRDRALTLTDRLGILGTPTLVVVDRDGRELYRAHEVPDDWSAILGGAAPATAGVVERVHDDASPGSGG